MSYLSENPYSYLPLLRPEYHPWIDTALCCISEFYRCIFNDSILCGECFLEVPPRERFYDLVGNHYIRIGEVATEQCRNCNVTIPRCRPAIRCLTCCGALNQLIRRLRAPSEESHVIREPYVITLAEIISCVGPREE